MNSKKYPFVVTDSKSHSMGKSLEKYVDIKMHQFIRDVNTDEYNEIVVVGEYDREAIISKYEKTGKLTNWQRPTAEVIDNTLFIKCFPGIDYVHHYASLISSYLAIKGKKYDHVSYILPTEEKCWEAVLNLPLEVVEKSDAVVIGSGLFNFTNEETIWQGNDQFLWATEELSNGKCVTYLIFQFSFWGDILYRLVKYLSDLGHKKIFFTAKVGGIDSSIIPNQTIATGDICYINGEIIKWNNPFAKVSSNIMITGSHINSPSVMYETHDWVKFFNKFVLVDSEIGYFVKAAYEEKMDFGYLHFVSNNLSQAHEEDLSNERSEEVIHKREILNNEIGKLIKKVV